MLGRLSDEAMPADGRRSKLERSSGIGEVGRLRDQGSGLRTSRRLAAGVAVAAIGAFVAPTSAGAAVIPVTDNGDGLACTLRLAIYSANHDSAFAGSGCPDGSGTDQIALGAGTYNLTQNGSVEDDDQAGDLDINTDLSIVGQGAGQTTIQWSGTVPEASRERVLDVHSLNANPITATISGVRIAGGRSQASDTGAPTAVGEGAGIRVINQSTGATTLNLDHSALQGNYAYSSSSFTLGGGLAVDSGAEANLNHVLIGDTSFPANGNFGILGAGLLNVGTVSLDKTTIAGNLSDGGGGAYSVGTLSAVNSTISANQANGTGLNSGGGGIFTSGTTNLSNVTLAENHTAVSGGAGLQVGSGTTTVKNSILADSFDAGSTPIDDCSGTITSAGHNLIEDNSCLGIVGSDQIGSDPSLGPLQDNGGSILTQLPAAGSPVLNAVPAAGCSDVDSTLLTEDQRGVVRPQGLDCDTGSVERDVTPPNTTITSGPSGPTNDPTPTFAFNSSEASSTFQCRVDAGSFASCTSPKTTAHLNDGTHTFIVRAVDRDGNPDPTPATRSVTVKTASVAVSGSSLLVSAAVGAKDDFAITKPTGTIIRITDLPAGTYTGSGVHTGAGCTRAGDYTANCNAAGVSTIVILSADMTDKVVNSTGMASSLNGGGANDMLLGGTGADTLIGGPSADVMKGMNGNDSLMARDGASDTTINCDGGTTPGKSDSADMDSLPKDSKVTGCEHQMRH
jgi:hypothetical protein